MSIFNQELIINLLLVTSAGEEVGRRNAHLSTKLLDAISVAIRRIACQT